MVAEAIGTLIFSMSSLTGTALPVDLQYPQSNSYASSGITETVSVETKPKESHSNTIKSFFIRSSSPLNGKSVEVILSDGSNKVIILTAPPEYEIEAKSDIFYESQLIGNLGNIQKVTVLDTPLSKYELVARYDNKDGIYNKAAVVDEEHGYGDIEFEKGYKRNFFTSIDLNGIVIREEWGAPTYSNWKPWITPISKIVVHHTAFVGNLEDPAETVRDIYFEHANRCSPYTPGCEGKWDDIGYNYIIDHNGTIYEGRAGGNGVVGAHSPDNYGTIGIGLLGNFHYDNVPTKDAINSLTYLIGKLSAVNGVELVWRDTIVGHRDRQTTSCPGEFLYSNLPAITDNARIVKSRSESILEIRNFFEDYNVIFGRTNIVRVDNIDILNSTQKEKLMSHTRNEHKVYEKDGRLLLELHSSLLPQYLIELKLMYPGLIFNDGDSFIKLTRP